MNSNFKAFKDGDLLVKELKSNEEKIQAYQLRHEIFHDELGWVEAIENRQEIDKYDNNAIMMGVYNEKHELIGTARIIYSSSPMMIEKEFADLVSESHTIRKNKDPFEVTRFGIKKSVRNKVKGKASLALYKGLYLWSLLNDMRYMYIVVDRMMMFNLKIKGIPCKKLGNIKINPDGCRSMSAIIDLREFEEKMKPTSKNASLRLNDSAFHGFCTNIAATYAV
jgi:acyl homoserine lactone synthase